MDIRKKLKKLRVAYLLPTMNRTDKLLRCVELYCKNCTVPTDIYVIDNNWEEEPIGKKRIQKVVTAPHLLVYDSGNPGKKKGVGYARHYGLELIRNSGIDYEYLVGIDDDLEIGEDAVERLIAPMLQNEKIGFLYAAMARKQFFKLKGRQPNSIMWAYLTFGCFALRMKALEGTGYDKRLKNMDDVDISFKIWDNGYYVGMIDIPAKHDWKDQNRVGIRHSNFEEMSRYIEIVTSNSSKVAERTEKDLGNGIVKIAIRKKFQYPKDRLMLNFDTLKLEKEE